MNNKVWKLMWLMPTLIFRFFVLQIYEKFPSLFLESMKIKAWLNSWIVKSLPESLSVTLPLFEPYSWSRQSLPRMINTQGGSFRPINSPTTILIFSSSAVPRHLTLMHFSLFWSHYRACVPSLSSLFENPTSDNHAFSCNLCSSSSQLQVREPRKSKILTSKWNHSKFSWK